MVTLSRNIIIALPLLCFISSQVQGREVSHIVIKGVGKHYSGRKDKNEENVCKKFKPTMQQLIRYFNKAKESPEGGEWLNKYYSPCFSVGQVIFHDGSSARWTLQSSGFSYVTFSGEKTIYFFNRDNQWEDPYACSYGLSGEPEDGCE